MIELDGSFESGGGQLLRTALSLSVYTGKPFRMKNIRINRPSPGLKRQHFTAIQALKKLCKAKTTGAFIGSRELEFYPSEFIPKNTEIDIQTAGSITLLLQSLLIPYVFSKKPSSIKIKGGTDVKWASPVDYFSKVFSFFIKPYADIRLSILKRGYYPKGQGEVKITINPKPNLSRIRIEEKGKLIEIGAISNASKSLLEKKVAERQLNSLISSLRDYKVKGISEYCDTASPGSGITAWALFENTIIGADSLGEPKISAEKVGEDCAEKLKKELEGENCLDAFMQDQIIPFLGILGGKAKTSKPTPHTLANIYVTEKFLGVRFKIKKDNKSYLISITK